MSDRDMRQLRTMQSKFETREDGEKLSIEGYFAVFNSNYEMAPGLSESFAPEAFDNTLSRDIRALINHDTTLVLGRTKANTLHLRTDAHGLWGSIDINPKDVDAMNLYERVKRGDVDQCSIGFNILSEETEFRDDGAIHWTIKKAELWEVSPCTFPAYEETNISARQKEREEILRRKNEAWKTNALKKLKGESPC